MAWDARATIAETETVDGWQPIATAPKDAGDVWAANADGDQWVAWQMSDGSWEWNDEYIDDPPTHWRPLPDPPKDSDPADSPCDPGQKP